MTRGSVLVLFLLVFSSIIYMTDEASGTASSFTEIGSTAFDVTSSGNFLSVGDWNSDGWEDLLVDGSRLYVNSGSPSFSFTLTPIAFSSSVSGGANGAWADFDEDGDLDLYQGCGQGTADRLWMNSGPPFYTMNDVSSLYFGTWSNTGPSTGSAWCDADGDGDLDIYVGSGEDWNDGNPINFPDFLLINDGTSFHDGTIAAGMTTGENFYSRGATWGDFNNDHLPDLYVSHYRIRENHLFVNQDDGLYTEEGRIRNCAGRYDTHVYYDATAGGIYGQYWWGPTYGHTIGSAWADFNNDGRLDLFTSDFVHKYVGWVGSSYDIRGYVCDDGKLYINDGGPWYNFEDHRQGSGIPIWPIGGSGVYQGDQTFSGVTVADFDNDGWLDLYIPQVYGDLPYTTPHLYRNLGNAVSIGRMPGTQFEDVTNVNGIKGANTYANLFWDYDRDGDMDLFTSGGDTWDGAKWTNYRLRLYRNEGNSNQWLRVRLDGDTVNDAAVGARVTLDYEAPNGHMAIMREVVAGTGHAHQQSNVLHFGLGASATNVSMEIVWPDGTIQEMQLTGIDREIVVVKPEREAPNALDIWTTPSQPHEGDTVNLTVSLKSSNGLSGCHWDLDGDDSFDVETKDNWVHFNAYNGGPMRAKVRITDNGGLSREAWFDYTIINDPPVVDVPDMTVNMDSFFKLPTGSISDSPSDMMNMTWSIDWGDGSAVNGTGGGWSDVPHVYTEPDGYNVMISCSDEEYPVEDWCVIEVHNVPPWGWIGPKMGNETIFHEDEEIDFSAHIFDTPSDQGPFDIMFEWGDGTTDPWIELGQVTHSFAKEGDYSIFAKVRDPFGGVGTLSGQAIVRNDPPVLSLKGAGSLDAEEDQRVDLGSLVKCIDTNSDLPLLEFIWDFGDGNISETSDSKDASHSYTMSGEYIAVCTARDDQGGNSSISVTVHVVNLPPVIDMLTAPADVDEDEIFTISVQASDTESDQPHLNSSIGLGDGRIVYGFLAQAEYPVSGQYSITITVVDDDGEIARSSVEIFVRNKAPSGRIAIPVGPYYEDSAIEFKASDLSDTQTDLNNLNITWDFGSGPKGYGERVNRTYKASGNYRVRMTVSDGELSETYTKTITVANLPPIAKANVDRTTAKAGTEVMFTANLSTDTPTDRSLLRYEWEIEGQKVPGISVRHSFTTPGQYSVDLTVTDPEGASSTDRISVTVEGGVKDDDGNGSFPFLLLTVPLLLLMLVVILLVVAISVRRWGQVVAQVPPPPIIQPSIQTPLAIPPIPAPPQERTPVPPPPAAPVAAASPSLPPVPPLRPGN